MVLNLIRILIITLSPIKFKELEIKKLIHWNNLVDIKSN
jgi:hypothetical protein